MEAYAVTIAEISQRTGTAILHAAVGGGEVFFDRAFARHGVPTFGSPERALWAYARATGRHR